MFGGTLSWPESLLHAVSFCSFSALLMTASQLASMSLLINPSRITLWGHTLPRVKLKPDYPTLLFSTMVQGKGRLLCNEYQGPSCQHLCLVSSASGFRRSEKPGHDNWLMKVASCWRGQEGLESRRFNGKQMLQPGLCVPSPSSRHQHSSDTCRHLAGHGMS